MTEAGPPAAGAPAPTAVVEPAPYGAGGSGAAPGERRAGSPRQQTGAALGAWENLRLALAAHLRAAAAVARRRRCA